ncbi:MAG: ATP-binding protein [Candidatus Thiodiazotropha sp. (ex Epidulcina cf. delphinae)]|nr:ATP-binding protein [Candidatus Thiodiazotropha sp. (ex Epidulcina cf. delphinae)]
MASAKQIKALLKSHMAGDDEHFYAVAMQLAAHEAKLGHGKLAQELRTLVDEAKAKRKIASAATKPTPIGQPRGELANLLEVTYPKTRIGHMILGDTIANQLTRIIKEQHHFAKIRSHGLSPRRKLLLVGPPGTGKTMMASALAGELGVPLFQVRLDTLITKYMGETAAKLRIVFDTISEVRGIYFFDEFDAIGSQRGMMNDVGEIRRILNSFLQMIEQDDSNNLIIAATNHPEILDYALFRRFDDIIDFKLPTPEQIIALVQSKLTGLTTNRIDWKLISQKAEGLSYAEVSRASEEAIKDAIIYDRKFISEQELIHPLEERKAIRTK